jgi:CheY-like chemotaxis protein
MLTETTNANLLLVEDSEDDAYFFKRTLQKSKNSCVVYHVTNGADAIEYLKSASTADSRSLPKVVFLDLKMPVLNGFEVLDWLKTQSFGRKMRVVVLSGSEHQTDKERAAQLGAADYLVKPVKAVDLDRFLRDVCLGDTEKEEGS